MAWFPSLPEDAGVRHLVSLNPAAGRALIEFHDAALRNALGLLPRDKELIAAYGSGLNACQYCYGVHSETARAFGIDSSLLEQQRTDFDTAPVDARLKSILAYGPAKLTQADDHAVFAVGWNELELHDAVLTICLFTTSRIVFWKVMASRATVRSTKPAGNRCTTMVTHLCCERCLRPSECSCLMEPLPFLDIARSVTCPRIC